MIFALLQRGFGLLPLRLQLLRLLFQRTQIALQLFALLQLLAQFFCRFGARQPLTIAIRLLPGLLRGKQRLFGLLLLLR